MQPARSQPNFWRSSRHMPEALLLGCLSVFITTAVMMHLPNEGSSFVPSFSWAWWQPFLASFLWGAIALYYFGNIHRSLMMRWRSLVWLAIVSTSLPVGGLVLLNVYGMTIDKMGLVASSAAGAAAGLIVALGFCLGVARLTLKQMALVFTVSTLTLFLTMLLGSMFTKSISGILFMLLIPYAWQTGMLLVLGDALYKNHALITADK